MKTKGRVNEIDSIVSQNLRFIRNNSGFSQGEVASAMGVSFQQLQKYEHGINRVSAGRLKMAADFLNVTPNDFFASNAPSPYSAGLNAQTEARLLVWKFKPCEAKKCIDAHLKRSSGEEDQAPFLFWKDVEGRYQKLTSGEDNTIDEMIDLINFVNTLEPQDHWGRTVFEGNAFSDLRSNLLSVVDDYKIL